MNKLKNTWRWILPRFIHLMAINAIVRYLRVTSVTSDTGHLSDLRYRSPQWPQIPKVTSVTSPHISTAVVFGGTELWNIFTTMVWKGRVKDIVWHCGGTIDFFFYFDVCIVWWSDGSINKQEYKNFEIYAVSFKISMTDYHHWRNCQTSGPGFIKGS